MKEGSAEGDAEQDANGDAPDANGLQGLEADAEAKREAVETEAPVQEQQRIARLAKQGLALVDAALGYGQEGDAHVPLPQYSWLFRGHESESKRHT